MKFIFNLLGTGTITQAEADTFFNQLYRDSKFDDRYESDEKLPLVVALPTKQKHIVVNITSKSQKHSLKITSIHSQLTDDDLIVNENVRCELPHEYVQQQCAWWKGDASASTTTSSKWDTLEHNGPYFIHLMEPYVPHGACIKYNGTTCTLNKDEEYVANFYARRLISEASGNVTLELTKDPIFNANFWNDFKTYLSPAHQKQFKQFEKLNFSLIVDKLVELCQQQKLTNGNNGNGTNGTKKSVLESKKEDYGYAIVNGVKESIGNYVVEPAAIFFGRGDNPHRGKIKKDIMPEDVTINIGEHSPIPAAPLGHAWKNVIHDHTLTWIAQWKEPISGKAKHVYLSADGQFKGKSDMIKYEKARKLNSVIDDIRECYTRDMSNQKSPKTRQLATVLYLIDNYGVRVGGDKDDNDTDTVGASTLRVEHVRLEDDNHVLFDFLGKDSVQFYKKIQVPTIVFDNFAECVASKSPGTLLFDKITAACINRYLKHFDPLFSAKVFRTRLASTIMHNSLRQSKLKANSSQLEKKAFFFKANVQVAITLNHKRTVTTKTTESVKKLKLEVSNMRKELSAKKAENANTSALEARIAKKKLQLNSKKSSMDISASTSLTNYIDPRLVVSWAKTTDTQISKIYTATLQNKFRWAIDTTPPDWDYIDSDISL